MPSAPRLTLQSLTLRLLSVPLARPIVSGPSVRRHTDGPFILIDLQANEAAVSRFLVR